MVERGCWCGANVFQRSNKAARWRVPMQGQMLLARLQARGPPTRPEAQSKAESERCANKARGPKHCQITISQRSVADDHQWRKCRKSLRRLGWFSSSSAWVLVQRAKATMAWATSSEVVGQTCSVVRQGSARQTADNIARGTTDAIMLPLIPCITTSVVCATVFGILAMG